jgi:peroxiredoxin
MSLQAKLDAFKANFEANIAPPGVAETFHRAIDELVASGAAMKALREGDRAPAFTLPDPEGAMVSSETLLARGPLVASFYRGVWCPYCNIELEALEAARAEIEERGATLIAISQQTSANSRKAQRQHNLTFPVLSDHGGKIAEAFGVRWTLPEYLRELQRKFGIDLAVVNGEESWTLPMPARYVIAPDGMIAYAEVNPDYTRRPEPLDLLPVLDALRARQSEKMSG